MEEEAPDVLGLSNHRPHLCGTAIAASILPESQWTKSKPTVLKNCEHVQKLMKNSIEKHI